MIFLFASLALIIGLFSVIPAILIRNRCPVAWWDYLYPFSGVLIWIGLLALNLGSRASLSNFIEVFWIALFSILISWVRLSFLFFMKRKGSFLMMSVLTLMPSLFAIAVRFLTPTLPE
ncbi:MAG: hypothetical protein RLZZ408_1739 [Verrucomicrobiota bacterium]